MQGTAKGKSGRGRVREKEMKGKDKGNMKKWKGKD